MVTREYYKTFKVGLPFRGKIPRPLGNVPGRPAIYYGGCPGGVTGLSNTVSR